MDNSYLLAYTDSTDVLIGKDLQIDDEYECEQFLKGNENELYRQPSAPMFSTDGNDWHVVAVTDGNVATRPFVHRDLHHIARHYGIYLLTVCPQVQPLVVVTPAGEWGISLFVR